MGGQGGWGGRGMQGNGGGGGGGGAGLYLAADGARIALNTWISGGTGGAGGQGDSESGDGGQGGTGIFVRGNDNAIAVHNTVSAGFGGYGGDAPSGGRAGLHGLSGAAADIGGTGNMLVLASAGVRLQGGDTLLAGGNTLRGNGSVWTLRLDAGATVAPGLATSVGGIDVLGTLHMPGGIFAVRIDATAHLSDRLAVTGPAEITGAHLQMNRLAGTPAAGQVYTLLQAQGGITGAFTLELAPGTLPPGTQARLVHLADRVNLEIVAAGPAPPGPGGVAPVPTLSSWGLAGLGMLLAGSALLLRRYRTGRNCRNVPPASPCT
ncbi:MAG: hypothetical protein J0H52_08575 [Comamonadaceae bacterium]|nr:hypothetical protein [Comamonadaceae bacterium]